MPCSCASSLTCLGRAPWSGRRCSRPGSPCAWPCASSVGGRALRSLELRLHVHQVLDLAHEELVPLGEVGDLLDASCPGGTPRRWRRGAGRWRSVSSCSMLLVGPVLRLQVDAGRSPASGSPSCMRLLDGAADGHDLAGAPSSGCPACGPRCGTCRTASGGS